MNDSLIKVSHGYYVLELYTKDAGRWLFTSNNERSFVISQLQDLLGGRARISDIPLHRQLSSHIDLLSYSITRRGISLVVFSVSEYSVRRLRRELEESITTYQWNYNYTAHSNTLKVTHSIRKLIGPHEALRTTVQLHLLHEDWEHDRYSSIGFYLHDRRGDWVRLWRLSKLYENTPEYYRELLHAALPRISSAL